MNESLLKKIPLFSTLDSTALSELASYLKRETYHPHETIFWMNEKGEHLYIILEGKVHICYSDEEGQEIIIAALGSGSFFGELSLIDGSPHSATARTVVDTVLLTLDRTSFYHFLAKHPQLSYTLIKVLSARLRANTIRMRGVLNVNEQLEAKNSSYQLFIDRLAKGLTSGTFITFCVVFILGWLAAQVYFFERINHSSISFLDKPPTFFILGFLVTLTSFLLTILILNSQRRQAENDRIRGEIEYQVNVKAQAEVMKLQLKMDKLIQIVSKLTNEEWQSKDEESFL